MGLTWVVLGGLCRIGSPQSLRRSTQRILALVSLIVGTTTAVRAQSPDEASTPRGACVRAVDGDGGSIRSPRVEWVLRNAPGERRKLDAHCDTVGPVVVRPMANTRRPFRTGDDVSVVGWNVHVGGGDLLALVRRLETGALTGSPVRHYILLLQEVHRVGNGNIGPPAAGLRVPRRIAPRSLTHTREDIVTIARRLDLSLYYVPSMRNGRDAPFEDRGNAILSTFPLDGLTAIELPIARQRRIAISARVFGVERNTPASSLRVNVAHLDALAGPSRLWMFAVGWRGHQARAILAGLDPHGPSVLAGDLNTWTFGRWESAYRRFSSAFPATRSTETLRGLRARGRLDTLLYRLAPSMTSRTWIPRAPCGTRDTRCGSDHRPIVGVISGLAPR